MAGGNLLGVEEQARWEDKGKKTEVGWREGRRPGKNDREGKGVGPRPAEKTYAFKDKKKVR